MSLVYTAKVTVGGGRAGTAVSDDKQLDVNLRFPKALGGDGAGTNPEQLVGAAYAACFESTLGFIAAAKKLTIQASGVVGIVELHSDPNGGFMIKKIELGVTLAGVTEVEALDLIAEAKKLCPFHKLVKNNVEQIYQLAD